MKLSTRCELRVMHVVYTRCARGVHGVCTVAGASKLVAAAAKSPASPDWGREACRVELLHGHRFVGTAVFVMRSKPFSPTPRRAPGRASFIPRPIYCPRDALHIACCVRLLRVVGAS